MDKQSFYRTLLPKKQKQSINLGIAFGYFTGGISLLVSIVTLTMISLNSYAAQRTYAYYWLDAFFILGLTIATHVTKNKICGLLLTILWAIEKIGMFFMGSGANFVSGLIGGLILFVFIYMTIALFQANKMWKDYRSSGTISQETMSEKKAQADLDAYKNQSHPSYTITAEEAKAAESAETVEVETIVENEGEDAGEELK